MYVSLCALCEMLCFLRSMFLRLHVLHVTRVLMDVVVFKSCTCSLLQVLRYYISQHIPLHRHVGEFSCTCSLCVHCARWFVSFDRRVCYFMFYMLPVCSWTWWGLRVVLVRYFKSYDVSLCVHCARLLLHVLHVTRVLIDVVVFKSCTCPLLLVHWNEMGCFL